MLLNINVWSIYLWLYIALVMILIGGVAGMNIFVAFFLLLRILADSTPPASSTVPLIGERSQRVTYVITGYMDVEHRISDRVMQ